MREREKDDPGGEPLVLLARTSMMTNRGQIIEL